MPVCLAWGYVLWSNYFYLHKSLLNWELFIGFLHPGQASCAVPNSGSGSVFSTGSASMLQPSLDYWEQAEATTHAQSHSASPSFVLLEFGTFCNPEIGMLSKPAISGLRVSSNFKSALAPWLELSFAASSQSRDCQVGQYGLQIAEEFLHSKGRCKETEQSCLATCIHSWQSGECRSVLLCYILNYQHFARTDTLCGLSFSFWMEVDRWFPFLSTTFFFWRKYWTGVCELHMGNMWPNKCLSSPLMCLWYHKVVFSTPPKYSTNLSECFRFFFLIWILAAK